MGVIQEKDLNFLMGDPHNNVGSWKLGISSDSYLTDYLNLPGSGIVVSVGDKEIFSGPTTKPQYVANSEDPRGTVTFEGVSDSIILADMLAWPQPANADVATQNVQHDVRTGAIETMIHAFVSANVGPLAPVGRRHPHLTMGTDGARGGTAGKRARFDVLGELIGSLAVVGDLGFQIVQRGSVLVFETYAVRDRRNEIRLDVVNDTLSAQKLTIAAPEITHSIVVGKGTGETARSLGMYTTQTSLNAQTDWGRRIERITNATSTDVAAELAQAGHEPLAERGYTAVNVQVSPLENNGMDFGVDWGKGDRLIVVVDEEEYTSVVTEFQIRADETGFYMGANLGDPSEFDPTVALRKRVARTGARISALERNG